MIDNVPEIDAILEDLRVGAAAIVLSAVPNDPAVRPGRNGRKLHLSTVHRWAGRGVRGVRLETLKNGGTTITTRPALLRFLSRLNGVKPSAAHRPQIQRERWLAKTEKALAAEGL